MKDFQTDYFSLFTSEYNFSALVFTSSGRSSGATTKFQDFNNFKEKGSTILVATPGRLTDLILAGAIVDYGLGNMANPIIRGLRSMVGYLLKLFHSVHCLLSSI